MLAQGIEQCKFCPVTINTHSFFFLIKSTTICDYFKEIHSDKHYIFIKKSTGSVLKVLKIVKQQHWDNHWIKTAVES